MNTKYEDNRRIWMDRKAGGHVETWPEGRRRGRLPNPLFSNISQHCTIGGEKVSEHLQMGPGEGYVLQRQTQLQSFSHTVILCCERTSPKA